MIKGTTDIEDFVEKDLAERAEIVKTWEAKEGKKIHDLSFRIAPKEVVRLFLREPVRLAKMRAYDLMKLGKFSESSDAIIVSSIIKEISDTRVLDDTSENDTIYLTALMVAEPLVAIYADALKKELDSREDLKSNEHRQQCAWIRYFFHIEPDNLTEDQFIDRVQELEYVLRQTGQWKE